MKLLAANKVVRIDGTFIALIDERIQWVIIQDDVLGIIDFNPVIAINDFATLCDKFNDKLDDAIQDKPEVEQILSADGEYDFTLMPKKQTCLKCFHLITAETAVLERRFAHCPYCGDQFYKAVRTDGRRDSPSWADYEPPRPKIVKEVKLTQEEKTYEQLVAEGINQATVRKVVLRFNIPKTIPKKK